MATEAKWSDLTSLDGAKTAAAVNQLLPAWVALLLVIVIAWQLARIVWMLVPAPATGDPVEAPPAAVTGAAADNPAVDVVTISNAHIFGVADPDAEPEIVQAVVDPNRDTRLSLELRGTIASTPDELGIAIISDGGRDEKVYAIGDAVTAGAKLHAVYSDRVVLNENGVLTNLKLPKDFPEGTPVVHQRDTTSTTRVVPDTQSIQSVVAQNVSTLANVIRPTPYFVDGQQQGYRVYPGRDRQLFVSLGLRPGDLIKDIDGQALNDPSQAMKIFQSLGNTDQVSVTVERNGQPEVIILRTSQLDIADETSQ